MLETPLETIARLVTQLDTRGTEVRRNERYFRGDQPLVYASAEWRAFNERRFANFSDNWCGVVGSSPAERIRLTGIRLGDDNDIQSTDEADLMRVWHENELDMASSQGFLHTIVASRSFVMVWPGDDGDPVVTWERADQVIVDYDPDTRRPARALKVWNDGETEYANLYYPTEVYKYQRDYTEIKTKTNVAYDKNFKQGEAAPYRLSDTNWEIREVPGESWPLQNPMGLVPIVEIPNRPMLGGDPISDIAGTIAMQDAINLLWAYLFAAADFASMPARVVMGQEPPQIPILDTDGKVIGTQPVDIEQLTKGRMLWLTGENTSIGQWEASRLDTFTEVINRCVRHVAAQTRTPVHYIVGEMSNVNGETLIAMETGLVKKVEEFHLFASGAMRQVFRLIALAMGNSALADKVRIGQILWADPQTRTQAQASDAALKDRQVGFPLAWVAEKRYGLTPPEIASLMAMRQTESDSLLAGVIGPPKDGNAGIIPAG